MARALEVVSPFLRVEFFKLSSPQQALLDLLQAMVIDPDSSGALVSKYIGLANNLFCLPCRRCVADMHARARALVRTCARSCVCVCVYAPCPSASCEATNQTKSTTVPPPINRPALASSFDVPNCSCCTLTLSSTPSLRVPFFASSNSSCSASINDARTCSSLRS